MKINETLFRKKPIQVFFEIDGKQIEREISIRTNITESNISKMLKKYHKNGLISKEKSGREVILNLTVKGKEIKEHMRQICELIEVSENDKLL